MKNLLVAAFLLIPVYANADWVTFHSTPSAKFTVKTVQFTEAAGSNSGVVKFWVNEYDSEAPLTTFYYSFPATSGLGLEQGKIFMSM